MTLVTIETSPRFTIPMSGKGDANIDRWLAVPEEARAELVDGAIVYHAFPGPKHGFSQGAVFTKLWLYNRRGNGGAAPSGWWLSQEVDMVLDNVGCRPDLVGFRRDKHPRLPATDDRGLITAAPDFVCEVLSSSTARYDLGKKRDAYFRAGVPHYWLVDPSYKTLTVLERSDRGYVILLSAGPEERVRAAPFEGVEINVSELFIDDEDEEPFPSVR